MKHPATTSTQHVSEASTSAPRPQRRGDSASNVLAVNETNNDRSAFGPWTIAQRSGRRTIRTTVKGSTGISPPNPNVTVAAGDHGRTTVPNRTVAKTPFVGPSSSNEKGRDYGSQFSILKEQEDGPRDAAMAATKEKLKEEVSTILISRFLRSKRTGRGMRQWLLQKRKL